MTTSFLSAPSIAQARVVSLRSEALSAPAEGLSVANQEDHRRLLEGEYWRRLPGFSSVSQEEFETHQFQQRATVTSVEQLRQVVGGLQSEGFFADLEKGLASAPMALRISPHLLGLANWEDPGDPILRQFLPLRRWQREDHPMSRLDSLGERRDSVVPGLTHRYRDKALFLPVDSCPVYCRFCTRSYAVGTDTERVGEKLKLHANAARWEQAFSYIEATPDLEDIVISGGDTYNLRAEHLEAIGFRLLSIPHVRRLRFATKGLCVMPQKILSDQKWVEALSRVVDRARKVHKTAVVHTHFNHPSEIAEVTRRAMNALVERGITVRCQSVLQSGVNAEAPVLQRLVRRLGYVNIQPYYVYFHDMVPGVEDLRTSLSAGLALEKEVRGVTAGFHTPAFVVDTMGGGGKRDAHSFEIYDASLGIAAYTSPSVKPGHLFFYFDPLHTLSAEVQSLWREPDTRLNLLQTFADRAHQKTGIPQAH